MRLSQRGEQKNVLINKFPGKSLGVGKTAGDPHVGHRHPPTPGVPFLRLTPMFPFSISSTSQGVLLNGLWSRNFLEAPRPVTAALHSPDTPRLSWPRCFPQAAPWPRSSAPQPKRPRASHAPARLASCLSPQAALVLPPQVLGKHEAASAALASDGVSFPNLTGSATPNSRMVD